MIYEQCDSSIPHCILIAHGPRPYEIYYVYDLVARWYSNKGADIVALMRQNMRAGAKLIEVEFPFGMYGKGHRQYTSLAGAKRAIEKASAP